MSMCSMIGEACTDNPADADKNYGKSVFGFMSNLIIIPYANPPASGVMESVLKEIGASSENPNT